MSSFVLQTTNQSLAHRLWRYAAASREGASFYPEGICEQVSACHACMLATAWCCYLAAAAAAATAVAGPPPLVYFLDGQALEVGPCNEKAGPCLVLFSGCTLAPEEVNSWIYSGASSSATVVRAYWLGATPGEASSHDDLVAQLRAAGPPPDGGGLRLQCAPRMLEAWLADQLGPAFNPQPVNPKWVLNVVCMAAEGGEEEGEEAGGAAAQQAAALAVGRPQQQDMAAAQAAGPRHDQLGGRQQQQGEHRRRRRILFSLQPAATLYNYSPVKDKRIPDQLSKAAGEHGVTGGCRSVTTHERHRAALANQPCSAWIDAAQPQPSRLPALARHLPATLPLPAAQASWRRRCRRAGSG